MVPWFRWINYINPIGYAFESLMINEFGNRRFPCGNYIPSGPGYGNASPLEKVCSTPGATLGADFVEGTAYLETSFRYKTSHLWR